jgi:ABC-type Fe3+/spermidine/putrescine transport system ATPase subunit
MPRTDPVRRPSGASDIHSPPALRATGPASLVFDRVTRRYPGTPRAARPAVDELSLELRAGELLALVGASGSGKTTTLRMAAGYETPDAGAVLLDGRDVTRLPPERRGFGMVFQHYALFPHLSVEENVAFGLEARGVARAPRLARARAALATVGLDGAGSRPVQALSGGEQQRVALARAVVIEPRVLLLDEPLSNLDPTLRQSTRDELRAMLHRLHVTALFVTHDQEDAFAVADRVALLRGGRLLQVGTPEELYDRPASRAVAEFIGRATLVPADDQGTHALVRVGGRERRVAVARPAGAPPRFARAFAVLRPETLGFTPPDWPESWPGTVVARRFAGAEYVYRVRLEGDVVAELATAERLAAEGETVGVRVVREPVALVGGQEERNEE